MNQLLYIVKLFVISLLLNFVWEISQMFLYATAGAGALSNYSEFISIHWLVSIKDALMVVSVYVLISLFSQNWLWIKKLDRKWLWLLFLPLWQGFIEYHAVYVSHRWAYNDLMPLILGIGIAPLLQMLILPPLALFLSKRAQ